MALGLPTIDVSVVDLTVELEKETTYVVDFEGCYRPAADAAPKKAAARSAATMFIFVLQLPTPPRTESRRTLTGRRNKRPVSRTEGSTQSHRSRRSRRKRPSPNIIKLQRAEDLRSDGRQSTQLMTTRVRPPLKDPSPPALTDVMLTETDVSLDGHFSDPARQINSDPSKVVSPDPRTTTNIMKTFRLKPTTKGTRPVSPQTRDGDGTEERTRQDGRPRHSPSGDYHQRRGHAATASST